MTRILSKTTLLALILGFYNNVTLYAQEKYFAAQGEYIFSIINADNQIMRFSMFPNAEETYNLDFKKIGFYTGIGLRNTGLIYSSTQKHKIRSLSFNFPFAIKLGNLPNRRYIALGADYDFLFHTKEKVFSGNQKTKQSSFFSNKTEMHQFSTFVGFGVGKFYFKLRYYLTPFLNANYQLPGSLVYPYKNMKTNLISFCVSYIVKNNLRKQKSKATPVFQAVI